MDIGRERRTIYIEPEPLPNSEPEQDPVVEPAAPQPEREPEPARP